MGMESVELVMDVEDHFGIDFPDSALSITTVGQLHDTILRLLEQKHESSPTPDAAIIACFDKLHAAIAPKLKAEPSRITPETPLADVIPRSKVVSLWRAVHRSTKLKLPALRTAADRIPRPDDFGGILIYTGIGALAVWFIISNLAEGGVWVPLAGGITAIVLGIWLEIRDRTESPVRIPADILTFHDLARNVVALNPKVFGTFLDPDQVWTALVAMIGDIAALPPKEITPQARFIEDLGFG